MEFLYEKVAYLKGLADGLDIEETTKEGKLLVKIIDILEDFADAIVEIDEDADEMAEYVEAMDEDLTNIEEDLYEDLDEEEDEDDDDDEDIEFVEVECPNCNEEVYIDEDLLYEDDIDVVCPRCNEKIELVEEVEGCCCNHDFDDEE